MKHPPTRYRGDGDERRARDYKTIGTHKLLMLAFNSPAHHSNMAWIERTREGRMVTPRSFECNTTMFVVGWGLTYSRGRAGERRVTGGHSATACREEEYRMRSFCKTLRQALLDRRALKPCPGRQIKFGVSLRSRAGKRVTGDHSAASNGNMEKRDKRKMSCAKTLILCGFEWMLAKPLIFHWF